MGPRWERGWVELAHGHELDWEPMHGDNWPAGADARALSLDGESGALSCVLRLPPGYRRGPGSHVGETEYYVISGGLRIGDTLRGRGYYEYLPPGASQADWVSDQGAEIFFAARTGRPDFIPGSGSANGNGRLQIDTERMPWQATPVEGPPPGLCVKMLRSVEATGKFAALVSNVPRFDYPKLEFHDCVEEIFCLSGDIWLGNSGTMRPGSYLWRPPFITHGPFYSESGCMFFLFCDETLINHFVDNPSMSIEENRSRREAELRGGS